MDPRRPEALLLLPIVLWLAWRAIRGSVVVMPRWRVRAATVARVLLLVAIVLALAETRAVLPRDELHTVFCVDRSASLDAKKERLALDWVADAARAMGSNDRAALVFFGEDAQVEKPLAATLEVPHEPQTLVRREATDVGRAIRLSLALLPEDVEKQVVVVTDGNENAGDALREARVAAANGVRVTTVHVSVTTEPGEVLVERVDAPPFVEKNEPYLVRATVVATSPVRARVAFARNGRLVKELEVDLAAGRNVVSLPEKLDAADAFSYEVTVSAAGDRNPANNQGLSLVRVLGEPRALIILRDAVHATPLARALEAAGMKVERSGASGLPLGRDELARWDLVVVGDVPAESWSPSQMIGIRDYVRDMGGGLLALGGEQSFGLGGYYGTPFEEALPVDSDIRKKKVLPPLAQVFVIDRSGSMTESTSDGANKLALAKEGVIRTLELLARQDMAGVVGFDTGASWVTPLERLADKSEAMRKVRAIEPGGGTAIYPALLEAVRALEKVEAQVKHVIVLTDGVSEPGDFLGLLDRCQRAKISVSTIGVGEKGDIDESFLEDMARRGGGDYHHAHRATEIPPLIAKDTLTASHALLIERDVKPVLVGSTELDWRPPPPPVFGFVLTEAKDDAEVILASAKDQTPPDEGPILARWRFGIGKSAAFTSDAASRWCKMWLGWEGYAALFGSLGRWLERDPRPAGLSTTLELESGRGVVTVEADERTPLELEARVSAPDGSKPIGMLRLEPVAPGRYRATFPATRSGVYFVGVEEIGARGARTGRGSAGAALAYPREYRELESNPGLLDRIARATDGKALSLADRPGLVWAHDRKPSRSPRSLAHLLAALAAVLLVLEVAARRLAFPPRKKAAVKRVVEPSNDLVLEKLLAKKAEEKKSERVVRATSSAQVPVATLPVAKPVVPPPVVSPAVVAPPKAGAKAPEPAADAPDEDSFTAQLLKAKKRAKKDER